MIEQPADFQAAEIRAQRQAGLRAEAVQPGLPGKLVDVVIHPRVLQTKAFGDGPTGFAVPEDGGLTLDW